jgi:hypothetical protein
VRRTKLALTIAIPLKPWARALAWFVGLGISLHVMALDVITHYGKK